MSKYLTLLLYLALLPLIFAESPTPTTQLPSLIDSGKGLTPKHNLLPSYEECGRPEENPSRIVGGTKCDLFDFPWLALLQYRRLGYAETLDTCGEHVFSCGGALINKRYILTAAHCINVPPNLKLVSVRLGEYDISKMVDEVPNQGNNQGKTIDVLIEKVIMHEKWDHTAKLNDIALIRLTKNVEYNDLIKPICLTNKGHHINGTHRLWIAGWGMTEKRRQSDIKLKVKVPVIDECQHQIQKETQFCAGGEHAKDSCRADSGGPAMRVHIDENTGQLVYIEEGIVSYGSFPCGIEGIPGTYTRVEAFIDWILSKLEP